MRVVKLQNVKNARDLGGLPVAGGRVVKPGLIFRSAALNRVEDVDADQLRDQLGIKLVVDLRVGWECERKPDVRIDGVDYRWIPYFDLEEVGVEYEKPVPGTIVIGHDFACDPDDFYSTMANPRTTAQMAKALSAIFASAQAGEPVLFHCSGGKDRAGITALLVLTVLGASEETILEDYLLTNQARDLNIDAIFRRFLRLAQGDEDLAWKLTRGHDALPQNLVAFRNAVRAQYGSMDAFVCDVLGVSADQRADLIDSLTQPA